MNEILNYKIYVQHTNYNNQSIPFDHRYNLLAALTSYFPELKTDTEKVWQILPIRGRNIKESRTRILLEDSYFTIRTLGSKANQILDLIDKPLILHNSFNSNHLQITRIAISKLKPVANLYSDFATFKVKDPELNHDSFYLPLFQELLENQIKPQEVTIEPSRKYFTVKGYKIIGYSVIVKGLSPEDSTKLQSIGLGGRRHMGCGIFVPLSA